MLGYMKNMVPLFFKIYFLKDSKLLSDLLQVTQFIRGEHRELCLLSWHFALDFTQRGEAGERWRKGERKQRENREREKTRGIKQRPYPFAGICHLKGRRQMHKAISSFPDRSSFTPCQWLMCPRETSLWSQPLHSWQGLGLGLGWRHGSRCELSLGVLEVIRKSEPTQRKSDTENKTNWIFWGNCFLPLTSSSL